MKRLVVAIVVLAALTGLAGTGPAQASPAGRAGNAGEDYAMLGAFTREAARSEELRARSLAAALVTRRIAETEQALAAWGVDRAGGAGQ